MKVIDASISSRMLPIIHKTLARSHELVSKVHFVMYRGVNAGGKEDDEWEKRRRRDGKGQHALHQREPVLKMLALPGQWVKKEEKESQGGNLSAQMKKQMGYKKLFVVW